MTDAEILQQGGILPSHSYRRLLDKGFTVSLAKTGVARLSLTIANTSRQEPSRDAAETSCADAATNTFAFKRQGPHGGLLPAEA
jgi:hypothetical protein